MRWATEEECQRAAEATGYTLKDVRWVLQRDYLINREVSPDLHRCYSALSDAVERGCVLTFDVKWYGAELLEWAADNLSDDATTDPVNHPSHYTAGSLECIDAIEAMLEGYPNAVEGFLAGQVLKYLWRAPLKGNRHQDLSKADWYLKRLQRRETHE